MIFNISTERVIENNYSRPQNQYLIANTQYRLIRLRSIRV
ncbi:hypothetical protein D1BOALGB6SA_7724 [Olavius sp. associated proteobacterium Delta 1]|nr:hypothetical protein D1BOALGB6SA_7724 [Olavius sp. associated proteobacterium Delta 1]